jgi:hypothetical protein
MGLYPEPVQYNFISLSSPHLGLLASQSVTWFGGRTARLVSWVELPEAAITSARYNTQQDKHHVQTSAFLRKESVQEWLEYREASKVLLDLICFIDFMQATL